VTGEWHTASELASRQLPGLPTTAVAIRAYLERSGALDGAEGARWRKREGRGGGIEYHCSALPLQAQAALALQTTDSSHSRSAAPRCRSEEGAAPDAPDQAKGALKRDGMWQWFERLPEKKKRTAAERARALDAVEALISNGTDKLAAMALVAREANVSRSTLYAWEALVLAIPREDWLPHLAPRHVGSLQRSECDSEAWDFLRADYLRPERPTFEACYRRLQAVAAERGWRLPSKRTLARRIEALPEATRVLAREGVEALKRLYPAQERTRGHFHALEAVNADGHKWDVFVRWPDGEVGRPVMIAWQDLYSGKVLAWRVDKTENKEATRLSFGDLVEQWGIPDHAWLDNGRQFASKWITGGAPNRFRFKIRDDEPLGLLTDLGVEAHWTTPYSGQSKPIERAFRDFATDTAKHPRFAGAWCGNNPLAKPENYASAAVPLDVFLQTVGEAIAEHNARPGRRSAVCQGRSFDAVFAESYAAAPIRRATEAQRRLWLLAAEAVGTARRDGSIAIEGNRFWAPFLTDLRGTRVSVRFDPQRLQQDLHVYALDGRYLGAAPCIEAAGFDNVEAARAHNRARAAWMRGQKMMLEAERRLTIRQVAEMLPSAPEPVVPERKVVRLMAGNAALASQSHELPEQSPDEIKLLRGMRSLRVVRGTHSHDVRGEDVLTE
jgi:putative transposase